MSCPLCPYHMFSRCPQKVRKSAHVLAVIESDMFARMGALRLVDDFDVYFILRTYDGSPTGETCAILGIGKRHIQDLPDKSSKLFEVLQESKQLSHIPGIDNLSPYRLNIIPYMVKFLKFVRDTELILFNIEPMGVDEIGKKLYPSANISIPGGGMEKEDDNCFERCGWREFREETGIDLQDYSDVRKITRQRITQPDRQSMYFMVRILPNLENLTEREETVTVLVDGDSIG